MAVFAEILEYNSLR